MYNQEFLYIFPLFAGVTALLTIMTEAVNRLHEETSQQIHGQVQGNHKVCRRHLYPKAKDAALYCYNVTVAGTFVILLLIGYTTYTATYLNIYSRRDLFAELYDNFVETHILILPNSSRH